MGIFCATVKRTITTTHHEAVVVPVSCVGFCLGDVLGCPVCCRLNYRDVYVPNMTPLLLKLYTEYSLIISRTSSYSCTEALRLLLNGTLLCFESEGRGWIVCSSNSEIQAPPFFGHSGSDFTAAVTCHWSVSGCGVLASRPLALKVTVRSWASLWQIHFQVSLNKSEYIRPFTGSYLLFSADFVSSILNIPPS